jgi:hypothetical protein
MILPRASPSSRICLHAIRITLCELVEGFLDVQAGLGRCLLETEVVFNAKVNHLLLTDSPLLLA